MRAIKFFLTATFIALATLPVTAPQTARGQNQTNTFFSIRDTGEQIREQHRTMISHAITIVRRKQCGILQTMHMIECFQS